MGICTSYTTNVYDNENVKKDKKQFEALQLTSHDVGRLYKIFRKVDVDGSGTIALAELLAHIDVERTQFSQRVFSIFDEDGSGEIDFKEFVLALWNYCTLSRATLDLFAFDLYDRDSSGFLSIEEVERMLKDIYGKAFNTNVYAKNISNNMHSLDEIGDIDAEAFCKFAKNHNALLFPAFEMQTALQRSTLGTAFWQRNSERRIEISKGRFVPIGKLMELHLNRSLWDQTMTSAGTVTAPVKDNAMMVMAVTGTRNQRQENVNFKEEEEKKYNKHIHNDDKPAAIAHRLTKEEAALAAKTQAFEEAHREMHSKETAKMLNTTPAPADPNAVAAAKKRRASLANNTVVPVRDDGNPSARLALFADIKDKPVPKGHDKRRKSHDEGSPQVSVHMPEVHTSIRSVNDKKHDGVAEGERHHHHHKGGNKQEKLEGKQSGVVGGGGDKPPKKRRGSLV